MTGPRPKIRGEHVLLAISFGVMMMIVGVGVYESYRAKKIDLIGKSEAFFVSTRAVNDFDRLKLAAKRAELGDPSLGDDLTLAFEITRTRMKQLQFETSHIDQDTDFARYFAKSTEQFTTIESIMQMPDCDVRCLGIRLGPALKKINRSLVKMRGAGLKFEFESRDYMAKLHTETIRKIYFTAALFTLLTALSLALLKQQNTRLRNEMMRAEESERRVLEVSDYRARFLAGMSHEFRTPLNAIKGFSQFLLMDKVNLSEKVRREYIGDIERSALDLESMTDTVLDLAKIDAGTFELHVEPVDLSKLAFDVVRQFGNDGDRLSLQAPDALILQCDQSAIKRCFQNLLSNALKFSDEAVEFVMEVNAQSVEIRVTDKGVGIPADEIDTVWFPYQRSSQTRSSDKQGTGLGLPITRELVNSMGGTIEIQSEPGLGTTIRIKFPRSMIVAVANNSDDAAAIPSRRADPTSEAPRQKFQTG